MSIRTLEGFVPDCTSTVSGRLAAWLNALHSTVRGHRAFNAAYAELNALDDRMLKDIGLSRSEIGSVLSDQSGERTIIADPVRHLHR